MVRWTEECQDTVTSSIVVNPHLSISVMVSPAGQGHGFVKGILETGGVMDKCVQMWTRNYGALGQTARVCFGVLCANRTREVKRDCCDLPIRRSEGRVVNTPLVVKKGSFSGDGRRPERRGRAEKKDKRVRERERTEGGGETEKREGRRKESGRERVMPALNGKKG
ncbi:hypothetical protein TNCV_329941 [Trichonephila clavipes]|nr:hypothetical protein TNCV_329941 [Trichonephila clavipes]